MREIKFRAWDKDGMTYSFCVHACGWVAYMNQDWLSEKSTPILMQYTGLKDKNGLTEVYEGDIIDENGIVKGNIYESPQIYKEGIDCLIEGMGTEAWRNTESIAMGRGCSYSK